MHISGDKKSSWSLTDAFKCGRGIWPAGQPAEEQTRKVSRGIEVLKQLINKDLKLFTFSLSVDSSGCWKAPGRTSNRSTTMNIKTCYWIIYQCEDTAQWITVIKENWTWMIFNYGQGLEINLILPGLPERWIHRSRFARSLCQKMWSFLYKPQFHMKSR